MAADESVGVVHYMNESGEIICEERSKPDWTKWRSVKVEEVDQDVTNMICVEIPTDEQELEKQTKRESEQREEILLAVPMMVQAYSADIPDAQALTIPLLFKIWTPGETYILHEIVNYNDELYRIGQPELQASEIYKPGDPGTGALYSHIEIGGDNYEVWKPWDGVSGIYQQDQIVHDPFDGGNLYKSKIPNNVWGPPSQQPDYWKKV